MLAKRLFRTENWYQVLYQFVSALIAFEIGDKNTESSVVAECKHGKIHGLVGGGSSGTPGATGKRR